MSLINLFEPSCELPAGLGAWMSTRAGGCSQVPWDSLNLGDHVGDAPADVQANRQRLTEVLGAPVRPVFLKQVHGTRVIELDAHTADGTVADACYSFAPGLACTIMVADCLPVLLWDTQGQWVAGAHAGWRGLAGQRGQGVLEVLWNTLLARGAQAWRTRVWLGPCIGPGAFEVGQEVLAAFASDASHSASGQGLLGFVPSQTHTPNKWLANLSALARQRLQGLGLTDIAGNDGTPKWCTVSNPERFFSHRRDAAARGSSGRMAACIWRNPR